jgi:hypothetical protein
MGERLDLKWDQQKKLRITPTLQGLIMDIAGTTVDFVLTDVESEYCYDAFFQRKDGIRLTLSMDDSGVLVPATYYTWSPESESVGETIEILRSKRGQKASYVIYPHDYWALRFQFEDGTKFSQRHNGLGCSHTSAFSDKVTELTPIPTLPFYAPLLTDAEVAENRAKIAEEDRQFDAQFNSEQVINGEVYSFGRNLEIVDAVLQGCIDDPEDTAEYGLQVTLKKAEKEWTEDWQLPNASPGSIETAAAFLRSKRGENVSVMSKRLPEAIYIEFASKSMWRASMPAKSGTEKTKFLFLDFE